MVFRGWEVDNIGLSVSFVADLYILCGLTLQNKGTCKVGLLNFVFC